MTKVKTIVTPATTEHAADRLLDAIRRCRAPVCVGLDPVVARIEPPKTVRSAKDGADCIADFTRRVLDQVAEVVPCVKFQSACFERWGHHGVERLERLCRDARERGLVVILDAKRGDIGVSAEHYAAAAFGSDHLPPTSDWTTVSPYLGADSWRPYIQDGHGFFILVRTSNPSGDDVQGPPLTAGGAVSDHVASLVAGFGEKCVGQSGFSAVGAVVGATKIDEMERLRQLMPRQIFLVPGVGAQGATAEDTRACFHPDGQGAIVTASRSVIYASDVRDAAQRLADSIGAVAGLR